MSMYAIDTLAFAKKLRNAGLSEVQTILKQDITDIRTELHKSLRSQTFAIIGAVGALMALFQFIG